METNSGPAAPSTEPNARKHLLDALTVAENQAIKAQDAETYALERQRELLVRLEGLSKEREELWTLKIQLTERLTRAQEKVLRLEGQVDAWSSAHQQALDKL